MRRSSRNRGSAGGTSEKSPREIAQAASANAAGEAIDSMKWSEVMGTIAGDNTLLIITRSTEDAEMLTARFNSMLNK